MSFRRSAMIATVTVAVGASLLAMPLANAATGNSNSENSSFTIGVWGDMPYAKGLITLPLALDGVDQVIADMNKQPLLFTVFDGDIKAGNKSYCGTATVDGVVDYNPYDNAKKMFDAVDVPTVYTPGDNEWTDCDRKKNGSLKPNDLLAKIRTDFFSAPLSQGASPMPVTQQSAAFPENARWEYNGVTFITINVPGTDNNYPQYNGTDMLDPDGNVTLDPKKQNGDLAEYTARNAANLAWLESGFADAKSKNSKGIMIIQQADMWATNGDVITHYAAEKEKLAALVSAAKVPVLLANGDSHVYVVDQPLLDANGSVVPNFQRVTTDGEGRFGWTRIQISPNSKNVFNLSQRLLFELPVDPPVAP